MKIKTPKQFAFFLAMFLAAIVEVIFILLAVLFFMEVPLYVFALLPLVFFGLFYAVVYYLLEKLITHKIRLLYRTIHNYKINKGDFPVKMDEDVLGKSEKEVMSWTEGNRDEIAKLKNQEEFRREFLGNLAHELKTPIFSIQGYILTLLEGGLEDPTINRTFLERASKGVDRMTQIIEDLDVITKIESERLKLDIEKVNIVKLSREIIEGLDFKAKRSEITLGFDKNYNLPEEILVLCDKGKIDQVLTNLIANSIRYGKEGGRTEIRFFDLEDNILVEVADDGIGIDQKHLPRLFERFYRVDKSRSRGDGGTGLGLAIAKHILEAHGQSINVRSTPGKGSTFSFTLRKA